MTTIKLKRGNYNQIQTNTFDEGEPLFSLDTKELFISDGVNNHLISKVLTGLISERPTDGISGKLYYSTDTNELFIYHNSQWILVNYNELKSPTINLTGDATGSGTLVNLNDTTINVSVLNSDQVDNYHAMVESIENTVSVRDSNGILYSKTPNILKYTGDEVVTIEYLNNIIKYVNANIFTIQETIPQANNFFGSSCSYILDTSNVPILAIGCSKYTQNFTAQGCVYIYDWNGVKWLQRSQIIPLDPAADDQFGTSCSLSQNGNMLAVGAPYWEGPLTNQGCVYIYEWDGNRWGQTKQLTAPDAAANDQFGKSCSLSSDGLRLAVGAPYWEGKLSDQGCVYIYDWDGTSWILDTQIQSPTPDKTDLFGSSCSLSGNGNFLAIGAPYKDDISTNQGFVYIFEKKINTWTLNSTIKPKDPAANDNFGNSCSLSEYGETLAVGAYLWEGSYSNQGCVYIFKKSNATWYEDNRITNINAEVNDNFGFSCSINETNNIIVIGSTGADRQLTNQGIIYIYKI